MDELVERVADTVGIGEDRARKAVTIMFGYLNKATPREKMEPLHSAFPDAAAIAPRKGMGGMMGAMSAMGELMALGLSMQDVQTTARETVRFARGKAGDEVVDDIVASIPELSQYL